MTNWSLTKELHRLETSIKDPDLDFASVYLHVQDLHSFVKTHPRIIRSETISSLTHVLNCPVHSGQTMSLFLYKAAADVLASISFLTHEKFLVDVSIRALRRAAGTISGNQQRAAAEALGSAPLSIQGPKIHEYIDSEIPKLKWETLLNSKRLPVCGSPSLIGRSIVMPIQKDPRVLVVKLAPTEKYAQLINKEAQWMHLLCSGDFHFPVRFDIPAPLNVGESFLFKLKDPPLKPFKNTVFNSDNYAMAFMIHKDYFFYPNDHDNARLRNEKLREILFRNAWLFGNLAAMGIVHLAPIPLFHNRTQQARRTDWGIYEWPRGGRLDQWLHSCQYPNFGLTGIRDFEHLVAISKSSEKIYQHIGNHILSLLLVAGSYFRNKNKNRFGFDSQGKPVDTRDFFEKEFFKELIQGVFLKYYHGFVGRAFHGEMPFDMEAFTSRMIEEMGVDRYMEEIFRVADQREMTDGQFRNFLRNKGLAKEGITCLERGREDIKIHSGPHLGGFNQRISLPELITFLMTAASLCIGDKYWCKKRESLL